MDIYKVDLEDGKWAWNHAVKLQVILKVLYHIFRSSGAWRWFTFYGHDRLTVSSFANPCSSIIRDTLLDEYPKGFS
jgi:hypothetical protein